MRFGSKALLMITTCVLALATQLPAAAQVDEAPQHAGVRVSISPVHVFSPTGDGALIQGAGSELTRSKAGVFMTFHAQGLTPGTVATAWWVFFNNPKACATSPCRVADLLSNPYSQPSLLYAAGRIVGADGTIDMGAFRAVGDTTGSESVPVPPFPAVNPGLLDPKNAEVHIVIRSHGATLMGDLLTAQLTTFNGGCPPNMCANVQASVHQP